MHTVYHVVYVVYALAENYRLDTEYENHLIYKVALVMKLIDSLL